MCKYNRNSLSCINHDKEYLTKVICAIDNGDYRLAKSMLRSYNIDLLRIKYYFENYGNTNDKFENSIDRNFIFNINEDTFNIDSALLYINQKDLPNSLKACNRIYNVINMKYEN